jgi:hypothetical protein
MAMNQLGNGLHEAKRHAGALTVREADLATRRRLGATEERMLCAKGNLAITYAKLARFDEALSMRRDVYFGRLKLNGEDNERTLMAANNYACSLVDLRCFEEAKALLRKTMPVARRVLGEGHELTLKMRWMYAQSLYKDPAATLDYVREAVTTLEDTERTARRVLGGTHPLTMQIEDLQQRSREVLSTHEDVGSISDAVGAL